MYYLQKDHNDPWSGIHRWHHVSERPPRMIAIRLRTSLLKEAYNWKNVGYARTFIHVSIREQTFLLPPVSLGESTADTMYYPHRLHEVGRIDGYQQPRFSWSIPDSTEQSKAFVRRYIGCYSS